MPTFARAQILGSSSAVIEMTMPVVRMDKIRNSFEFTLDFLFSL